MEFKELLSVIGDFILGIVILTLANNYYNLGYSVFSTIGVSLGYLAIMILNKSLNNYLLEKESKEFK